MSPWERRKVLLEVNFLIFPPNAAKFTEVSNFTSGSGEALRERGAIRDCKSGSKLFHMRTGGTLVSFPGLGFLPGDQPAQHDPGPTSFGGIFLAFEGF